MGRVAETEEEWPGWEKEEGVPDHSWLGEV